MSLAALPLMCVPPCAPPSNPVLQSTTPCPATLTATLCLCLGSPTTSATPPWRSGSTRRCRGCAPDQLSLLVAAALTQRCAFLAIAGPAGNTCLSSSSRVSELQFDCPPLPQKLIDLQNTRGGRVRLNAIVMPETEYDHPDKGARFLPAGLVGLCTLAECGVPRSRQMLPGNPNRAGTARPPPLS